MRHAYGKDKNHVDQFTLINLHIKPRFHKYLFIIETLLAIVFRVSPV
jgi:hypothetical protein